MDYSYYNELKKLEFYVLGSEENYIDGAVSITNKELFKGDIPVQGGIYDPGMGTTEYMWNCATCFNKKTICPGHSGSLDLKYPVKSPLFKEHILKWLKIICFKCGRLLVTKDIDLAPTKIMNEYIKLSKMVSTCPYNDCKEPHPQVFKDKFRPLSFYIFVKGEKGENIKQELYNHTIKNILNKISDETLNKLKKNQDVHPKKFILDIIRIAPNTIRPDIRKIGGSRSNNSDITTLSKFIVEINDSLPVEVPEPQNIDNNLDKMYYNLDMAYYEMVKGSTTSNNQLRMESSTKKPPMSIANRLPKKLGRIRKNLMGKRTKNMGRSVISGDNSLKINEIGLPIEIATSIQIPETVRDYNKNKLNIYFMNKRDLYPGCSGIKINATGKFHKIQHLDPYYVLKEGDIVYRDIVDGDYIAFNRQPSLLFGQISSHKVKVMDKTKTLRINVSACAPYNADFDGDRLSVSPTGGCL
jgi:DNA-directed RNA polymerase beta' subunit